MSRVSSLVTDSVRCDQKWFGSAVGTFAAPVAVVVFRCVAFRLVVFGFRVVGLRVVTTFRVVGFRVVSFRVVSIRVVGFRVVGFRVVGFRVVFLCVVAVASTIAIDIMATSRAAMSSERIVVGDMRILWRCE